MKYLFSVLLTFASFSAAAKEAQVVPVGKGVYMLTRKNATIFGSSDGIIAKLMVQSNSYCETKKFGQAELINSDGSEAIPGSGKPAGQGATFGQGAIGTVYFRCSEEIKAVSPTAQTTPSQGKYLQFKTGDSVSAQITFASNEECSTLVTASSSCQATSIETTLPFRAVLQDPEDHGVLVVDTIDENTCLGVLAGINSKNSLTVLTNCSNK